jgi:ribosome assembly protein 1
MLHPELGHLDESIEPRNKLEADLYSGSTEEEAFTTAYVSKMFAVKRDELPENQRKQLTAEDMRERARQLKEEKERIARLRAEGVSEEEIAAGAPPPPPTAEEDEARRAEEKASQDPDALIGFARLYSGTLKLNSTLYAVLPKYNGALPPSHPQNVKHIVPVKVEQLYMMMGRELLAVNEVQAGNLFAIGGLEGKVWRNATLCGMGSGKEVKEGAERDEDRECLINLAGITNNVRLLSLPTPLSLSCELIENRRSGPAHRSCRPRTSRPV